MDPEELNSIKNSNLEQQLLNDLILQLDENPDSIADRVESYNRNSFMRWKNEQGRAYNTIWNSLSIIASPWSPVEGKDYVENISNLRWEIDFKRKQAQNLDLIEKWLSEPTSGRLTDRADMARLIIDSNDPKWVQIEIISIGRM